jgi:hypothetical protein
MKKPPVEGACSICKESSCVGCNIAEFPTDRCPQRLTLNNSITDHDLAVKINEIIDYLGISKVRE